MTRCLFLIILLLPVLSSGQTALEHYESALANLNKGATVQQVLNDLELCIRKDSTFEDAYLLSAFVYIKLEGYEEAIEEYDKLLRVKPHSMEALKRRALTKLQVHDYEGAVEDHNIRLSFEPQNPVVYFDRAYCRGLLKDIEGAIEDYTKAIELDPNYKEAWRNRGTAQLGLITHSTSLIEGYSMESACADLNEAMRLGDSTVVRLMSEYCGN